MITNRAQDAAGEHNNIDDNASASDNWLLEELALTGIPAQRIRFAVFAGAPSSADIRLMAEIAPSLEQIIVFETDTESARGCEAARGDLCEAGFSTKIAVHQFSSPPVREYSAETYLKLLSYWMNRHEGFSRSLFAVEPAFGNSANADKQAVTAAFLDFRWGFSTRFLRIIRDLPAEKLSPFEKWADHLKMIGEPFHAYVFYDYLARKTSKERFAAQALVCLEAFGCHTLADRWLPSLADTSERERFTENFFSLSERETQRRQQLRQKNTSLITKRFESQAARLLGVEPKFRVHRATLSNVPWRLNPKGPSGQKAQRDTFELFFVVNNSGIEVLNPPSSLRPILKGLSGHSAPHVVIGTIRRPHVISNILTHRPRSHLPRAEEAIYFMEPNTELFVSMLEVLDLTEWLERPFTELFVGHDCGNELCDRFRNNANLPIPLIQMDCPATLIGDLVEIAKEHDHAANRLKSQLFDNYDEHRERGIKEAFSGEAGRPLKVCVYTSIYTTALRYIAEDLVEGFRDIGVDCKLVMENSHIERLHSRNVLQTLLDFSPDLLVGIDFLRPVFASIIPERLPFACWIIDDLPRLHNTKVIDKLGPRDFAYSLDKDWIENYKTLGYPHVKHLSMATNPHKYFANSSGDDSADCHTEMIENKVSFITHVPQPLEPPNTPGLWQWAVPRLMEESRPLPLISQYRPLLEKGLEELGHQVPKEGMRDLLFAVHMLSRMLDRIRVVTWILEAGYPVALFGDGWDKFDAFKPYHLGRLAPGAQIRQVFQRSKIVLHVNNNINLHMRVFEAMSSGGFVIARTNSSDHLPGGLHEHLEVGKEIVLFETRQELVGILERAYNDEPWRQSIIEAGKNRVLADHCYSNRARFIIEDIAAEYAGCRLALPNTVQNKAPQC